MRRTTEITWLPQSNFLPQGRISYAVITTNSNIHEYTAFCCFAVVFVHTFSQMSNLELCWCNLRPPLLISLLSKNSVFPPLPYHSPRFPSFLSFLSLPFQSFVTGHFFLSDLFLYLFLDSYWLMNIFLKLMYSKVGNIIYSANMSTQTKTTVKNDNLSILTNPTGLQVHGN